MQAGCSAALEFFSSVSCCLFFQLRHRDSMKYRVGAAQALLITAETGLPQAEQHGVYLYIPACMHATAVHVWCGVHISVLVSSYVSSMGVCPSPRPPVLAAYNIQDPFIKVKRRLLPHRRGCVC